MSPAAFQRSAATNPPWLRIVLAVGLALALGATALVVFSDQVRLLRLAAVLALWAALIGAFAVTRARREARVAELRQAESRHVYELELHREVSARREYEIKLASEAHATTDERHREELAALREQLDRLNTTLLNLTGLGEGDLLVERLTLSTEATRIRQLGDPAANRSNRLASRMTALESAPGPETISPTWPEPVARSQTPPAPAAVTPLPPAGVTPGPTAEPAPERIPEPSPLPEAIPVPEVHPVPLPEPEVVLEPKRIPEPQPLPEAIPVPEVRPEPPAAPEPPPSPASEASRQREPLVAAQWERAPAHAPTHDSWRPRVVPATQEQEAEEPAEAAGHASGVSVAELLAALGGSESRPHRRRRAEDPD